MKRKSEAVTLPPRGEYNLGMIRYLKAACRPLNEHSGASFEMEPPFCYRVWSELGELGVISLQMGEWEFVVDSDEKVVLTFEMLNDIERKLVALEG